MAHIKDIAKTRLIIGIMYAKKEVYEKIIDKLIHKFGKVHSTLEYDFDFTDYYNPEMGEGIKKTLVLFEDLIDREDLAEIKTYTNTIEDDNSINDNRNINLDPGYMTIHNVVLASAKEMPHKIYIGNGLFGDVVLEYKQKSFQHSPHTFPDFKSDNVKLFLNKERIKLKQQLKASFLNSGIDNIEASKEEE